MIKYMDTFSWRERGLDDDRLEVNDTEETNYYCNLVEAGSQDPDVCLEAVKINPWILGLVKNQTREICLEAVKRNGAALKYV